MQTSIKIYTICTNVLESIQHCDWSVFVFSNLLDMLVSHILNILSIYTHMQTSIIIYTICTNINTTL